MERYNNNLDNCTFPMVQQEKACSYIYDTPENDTTRNETSICHSQEMNNDHKIMYTSDSD